MSKSKILVQFDSDEHASVFDAVVATDAGVDRLLQYGNVRPEQVRDLVHGAIFTRGVPDLKSTAIFVGGSNVAKSEELLRQVTRTFFGPMRVSVMFDANGANTTAAAAVLSASRHVDPSSVTATILAATGPVGQRVVRILARLGATVRVVSRDVSRAELVCRKLTESLPQAKLEALGAESPADVTRALDGAELLIAAGAAGVQLVSKEHRKATRSLRVAVDLNAVPPLGIEGIEVQDKGVERDGVIGYGAIGVGGLKMKIHKAAIARLFSSADAVLDAEEIHALGQELA